MTIDGSLVLNIASRVVPGTWIVQLVKELDRVLPFSAKRCRSRGDALASAISVFAVLNSGLPEPHSVAGLSITASCGGCHDLIAVTPKRG